MGADRNRKRLYSETEIGALIQRATDIQREAHESAERGLSLDEIEHIAAELGVDPEHLRSAAKELESRPSADEGFRFWGGPFLHEHERVVEGTVSDEQWEQIVQGLRRLTGSRGRVDTIGQTREWTRSIKDMDLLLEQTQVAVRSRKDQTTINVRKQYRGGARVAYVLGIVLSGTVAAAFLDSAGLSAMWDTIILGGSGVGALAIVRTSMAAWTRRQRQKVKGITDWLHDAISQTDASGSDVQATVVLPDPAREVDSQQVVPLIPRMRT